MPPKPRFTREEIVAAALDIVSRKGIEALTARELGETLGSFAHPIFTVFRSMEELQQEVRSAAMRRFESYAGRTMPGVPLFKQVGMQMVLFGAQEPKLYQLLFMRENRSAVSFDDVFGGAAGADALHGVSGDDAAGEIRRPVVIGEGGGWTLRWILCPACGGKTRTQIRSDTVLENFLLFCPKCKGTFLISVRGGETKYLHQPDAKTQS